MSGPAPGRFGKYAVVRKLASGGMADVYLCRYEGREGFRKTIAVKAIHPACSGNPRSREFFAREARLAASLSHPNLVHVFDFGREGDRDFLAMEYVEGWNLAQAIARSGGGGAPVPPGVFRQWILGILSAAGYLHERGVMHRDISPSNVLLSRSGAVKIADFGIALAARSAVPPGEPPVGKAGYLAPEVAAGGPCSVPSDLFAVAVMAAELLLAKRLFPGSSREVVLEQVRAHDERLVPWDRVPAPLRDVIRTGLAADPSRRFGSAAGFAEAVAGAVPGSSGIGELEAYWDRLFPPSAPEEETVGPAEGRAAVVRERRAAYGEKKGRILRFGIVPVLAAAGLGGLFLSRGPGTARSPEPVRQQIPSAAAERATVPEGVGRGEAGRSAVPEPGRAERAPAGRSPRVETSAGTILETDPPGAYVLLEDGTRLGKTPLALDERIATANRIALEMTGYERKVIAAGVLAGIPRFRTELERQIGTFEVIQAIPWAKVYDGDRYLGETPLLSVRLPSGERRLRFVNEPLGAERAETIVVRPGTNPSLIVTLTGAKGNP